MTMMHDWHPLDAVQAAEHLQTLAQESRGVLADIRPGL